MNNKLVVFSLILAMGLTSCGSHKNTVTYKNYNPKKYNNDVVVIPKEDLEDSKAVFKLIKNEVINPQPEKLEYIKNYAPLAMIEMDTYKIPASITLAQGILESRSGRSKLALRSNNHFGVKCHSDWNGERVYYDDDEKNECFRKYSHPIGSFQDHSQFLKKGERYASLFNLRKDNYEGWAKGLKKAGYATDPHYPNKLIKIIENYHLYKYDTAVLHHKRFKNELDTAMRNDAVNTSTVANAMPISKEINIQQVKMPDSTAIANNYNNEHGVKIDTFRVRNGKKLYAIAIIQPISEPTKKVDNKASVKDSIKQGDIKLTTETFTNIINETYKKKLANNEIYIVKKGETLYAISKKFNVKVTDLKTWNKLNSNELSIGKVILVKKPEEQQSNKTVSNTTYKVKKGETLYAISKKFNVKVADIKTWNNLTSNELKIGQEIIIKK